MLAQFHVISPRRQTLLGGKQNFLGLFITAIRSDGCSVAAFYPAATWPPLSPNEGQLIPNPVSTDSRVASHLGPWLPGVMILPFPGYDFVVECSSCVCVFIPCVCSFPVFTPGVCVHPLYVCSSPMFVLSPVCIHLLCVGSHTHLGFASDPSKVSLLALATYLSSLNLDFCSRKPG